MSTHVKCVLNGYKENHVSKWYGKFMILSNCVPWYCYFPQENNGVTLNIINLEWSG